jgi:hypothetical protein
VAFPVSAGERFLARSHDQNARRVALTIHRSVTAWCAMQAPAVSCRQKHVARSARQF